MTNYERFTEEVVNGFRNNHGRCGVYINRPISPIGCIITLLTHFFSINKERKVCIIVKDSVILKEISNAINSRFLTYKIDIITKQFTNKLDNYKYDLVITINIEDLTKLKTIQYNNNIKFYLFIFDNRIVGDKQTIKREAIIKFIHTTVSIDKIIEESIHSPVKETLVRAFLTDEHYEEYKKYDDYIKDSIRIFGNLETLDRCRMGDKIMNRSNIAVCTIVANNNGWSENLDSHTPFGKQIDELYNPNALLERAFNTYNIIKKRKDYVTDAIEKIDTVIDIIKQHPNEKILIVSPRGEFANSITDTLNKCIDIKGTDDYIELCVNYHNCIPDTIQKDKFGNTVLIKSGLHKGEPKVIGWKKQSTIAQERFNNNEVNIISIKAASDIDLNIDCDIIILTSPLCGTITDIRRRFKNVIFRTNPIKVYTIYLSNTIENVKVDKYESTINHEIINDDENFIVVE